MNQLFLLVKVCITFFLGVRNNNNIFGNFVRHLFIWVLSIVGLIEHLCEKWKGQVKMKNQGMQNEKVVTLVSEIKEVEGLEENSSL